MMLYNEQVIYTAHLQKTATETFEEMAAYIKEKLPRYMVPNVIKQLDTMPLTPNGKINRNLLKQQYEQGI